MNENANVPGSKGIMELFGNKGKNAKHLKKKGTHSAGTAGRHAATTVSAAPTRSTAVPERSVAAPARSTAAPERSVAAPARSTAVPERSAATPARRAAMASASAAASRRKRRGRTVAIVSAILVLLVVGTVVGYAVWEKPPEVVVATPTPMVVHTAPPVQTTAPEEPEEEPEDDFEGALLTDRNDGVYTFLLAGRDHESNSTDTIIVGKFDTVNHTLDAVNIPRDTLINIGWNNSPKKINSAYPGYINGGEDGIEGLLKHLRDFVGFDVDCYAIVNLDVVEQVINAIGGVDFDVPINMDYDDPTQDFHVHLQAGEQHLDGSEALGVFRFRSSNNGGGYPGGDLERIGVQQSLIKTIAADMLSLGNIPNLTKVIELLVQNVETDLNASNMAFFARQFLKCKMANVNFHTAPVGTTCYINGISYVSTDVTKWLEMVNKLLNPFTEDVTLANVNILTASADGNSVTSTTGSIAGGLNSFWCYADGCPQKGSAHAPGAHNNSAGGQTTVTNPGTTNPGTTNPGTANPGTTDPGTTDPGTTDPGTTDPGTTSPSTPSEPSTTAPDLSTGGE